jgi:acyl-CoA dehydrogenase
LCSATLRRFEAEGRKPEDEPFLRWAAEHALANMQTAREGIYDNLRLPGLGHILRLPGLLWARLGAFGRGPDDRLGHEVARALQTPGAARDRLTPGIHIPPVAATQPSELQALARLELALDLCTQAEPLQKKLKDAVRHKLLPKAGIEQLLDQAVENGILAPAERDLLQRAETARREAITVDSFSLEEYLASAHRDAATQTAGSRA